MTITLKVTDKHASGSCLNRQDYETADNSIFREQNTRKRDPAVSRKRPMSLTGLSADLTIACLISSATVDQHISQCPFTRDGHLVR
jgi:hypothetical protein